MVYQAYNFYPVRLKTWDKQRFSRRFSSCSSYDWCIMGNSHPKRPNQKMGLQVWCINVKNETPEVNQLSNRHEWCIVGNFIAVRTKHVGIDCSPKDVLVQSSFSSNEWCIMGHFSPLLWLKYLSVSQELDLTSSANRHWSMKMNSMSFPSKQESTVWRTSFIPSFLTKTNQKTIDNWKIKHLQCTKMLQLQNCRF